MTVESILLVAFLVFPLLARLARFLRGRAEAATADPAAAAPRRPPPPVEVSVADAMTPGAGQTRVPARMPPPVVMPASAPRHPAVDRPSASQRIRASRLIQGDAAPAVAIVARPRTRSSALRISGSADLQRAVVLMAILGPCKAVENQPGPAHTRVERPPR